jgi:hypothetical protein
MPIGNQTFKRCRAGERKNWKADLSISISQFSIAEHSDALSEMQLSRVQNPYHVSCISIRQSKPSTTLGNQKLEGSFGVNNLCTGDDGYFAGYI